MDDIQAVIPTAPQEPKQKLSKKLLALIVISIFLLILVVIWFFLIRSSDSPGIGGNKNTSQSTSNDNSSSYENKSIIRLIATGDFIAHDAVNKNALKSDGSYDYLPFMSEFIPIFKAADIRFCNDPILNGGKEFGISGYPTFNSPSEFVDDMKNLGCNLVNTASNHSFDKTQAVIDASVAAWEKQNNTLAVVGQNRSSNERDRVNIFTVKGVKIAFLAYTTYLNKGSSPNDFGVNLFSKDFATRQITEAKQAGAKIIIASMRWGMEYSESENTQQQSDAQFLSDQGVSLILGHGPHVLQPVEILKGTGGNETAVWYSLGNFLNTQETAESLFGALGIVDFNVTDGKISKLSYLPIYMHYEWSVAQKAAGDLLSRKNLKLLLLENTTQELIDKNQLKTTTRAQQDRINLTLNKLVPVVRLSSKEYFSN